MACRLVIIVRSFVRCITRSFYFAHRVYLCFYMIVTVNSDYVQFILQYNLVFCVQCRCILLIYISVQ